MNMSNETIADFNSAISDFLNVAADDPRIGPLHISLYYAILHYYNLGNGEVPVTVFGKDLMRHAKISSHCTYHRYIQELHKYGYIHYIPSYNPFLGSLIYPLKLEAAKK